MAARINNVQVYGLAESIYRSGYPMMDVAPTEAEFSTAVETIRADIENRTIDAHIRRGINLANAKGGGHDQFLTGILVNFDLTFSNKAWVEAERYTFLNFISSMSTMHRISKMPISKCCNEHTPKVLVEHITELQSRYEKIDGTEFPEEKKSAYLDLLYNLPSGFEITAGMTTNYRCLKNIYAQRRTHRLPDWHVFCDWVETLPMAKQLICGGVADENA